MSTVRWTLRWSGELRVRVTLHEATTAAHPNGASRDRYVCTVRAKNGARYQCTVFPPAVLTHAIDSSEAFDDVARAAITFANDEYGDAYAVCAFTDDMSEIIVARRVADRWGAT